jgi:hypothetical protein
MVDAAGRWGADALGESEGYTDSPGRVGVFDDGRSEPFALTPGCGMLAAPDGAWVREGSREFFAALGDPNPDYDAPLFAVKNLGFVSLRVLPSRIDITLHPRNVSPAALRSLELLLPSLRSDLFYLSHLETDWVSETVSSPARTLCRLAEICAREGVGVTAQQSEARVH